jgi:hypothetical protein
MSDALKFSSDIYPTGIRSAGASRAQAHGPYRLRRLKECIAFFAALLGLIMVAGPAAADKIKHPIAVFSGLDKITGRIITFDVATNETVQFGSLQITERVCYSRPPTEAPQTDTFIEVDNIDANNESKRIFTGWMFAGSPSLHALDHPVYDIWLLSCKGSGELIPEAAAADPSPSAVVPNQNAAAVPSSNPPAKKPVHQKEEAKKTPALSGAPIEVGPPPGFVSPDEQDAPPRDSAPPQNGDGF